MAITSKFLKDIMTEARPIIERQMDDAKLIAGFRSVVANAGGDWGALKALIKASVQDDDDGGTRVQKIMDKADDTAAYADMLGLAKMNEKNFSADDEAIDPQTGEILQSDREHDVPVVHASADAASDDASAPIHESPSNRDVSADGEAWAPGAPQGYPDQPQAKAEVEASNDEPSELAGHEGRSEGEAASAGLPPNQPEPVEALSEVALPTTDDDTGLSGLGRASGTGSAGGTGSTPVQAPPFNNPRCQHPDTCTFAHSRDCCFDCSIAWSERPKDEQIRLWQEAIGAAA